MILVYEGNLKPEQKAELEQILAPFELRKLGDVHLEQTMQELSGSDFKDVENPECGDRPPFLYFVNEDLKDISRIQSQLEEKHVPLFGMAVETENNKSFTLKAQMEEVAQEAEYFAKINELADLLSQADPEKMRTDQDYGSCHLLAARLLHEEEISENMLDTALAVIRSFHPEQS